MKKIINILDKYKGLLLIIITFATMLSMYTNRIAEIREQENQVSIQEKR